MRNVIALWHYTELPEFNGGSELSAGPRPQARSSRAWACLPHTSFTPGPTTTARTPRRLHCSSSRVYPADVRELARPARQPSRGRAVVPYDVRRGAAGSGFPDVRPGTVRRVPSVRMDHYYRGAMLKDKNSSRSEAQPQGARRRASGAGRSRPSNGTPRGRRERTARVLRLGSTTHLDHTKPPRDCRARPLSGSSSRSRTRNPKARAW